MACLASLLAVAGCTSGPTRVLKIGVDLPLSGQEGRAGSPALNGIRFFVQKHPTISGFTVVVDARDRSEERRVGKECRSRWSPYH